MRSQTCTIERNTGKGPQYRIIAVRVGVEQSEPVDEEDVGGDERVFEDGRLGCSLALEDNKARLSICSLFKLSV